MKIKYIMFPNSKALRIGEETFTMDLFTDIIISWCVKYPEITSPKHLLSILDTYNISKSYKDSMKFFIDLYYTQCQRIIKKFQSQSLFR